ncbi:MAG: transglutaminase-like domain-containing protein, partial [candidate division WOR-3 bacterium]
LTEVPAETIALYTTSSNLFDLGSNEVTAAADEAIGSDTLLLKKIARIFNYVQERIKPGGHPEFFTARDIIRRGEGSAEERIILLSALCRQKGIPTRLLATEKSRLLQIYLAPYGWLILDPVDGGFFIGGELILQQQSDYLNFLYQGWDSGIQVRRNGVWIRAKDLPRAKISEKVDY